MPTAAPKPCRVCSALVYDGTTRCAKHQANGSFADKARGTRHERGYGSAWVRIRQRILARDSGLCTCADCVQSGSVRIATEVDHRINKATWLARFGSLDGVDDESNLAAINKECHKAKTAREAAAARVGEGDLYL